jgi:pSer/pThr/pTyr-binding forkhead associated (FHA) protein
MADMLEVFRSEGTSMVALAGGKFAVGKADTNDVCIDDDPTVSSLHAVVERFGPGWTIRDLGSTNGTFVNGDKVTAERVLRPGDEIRVGSTRIVFRSSADRPVTQVAEPPPKVAPDQRPVLVALCRPVLEGDAFTEPATLQEVAAELGIDQADASARLQELRAVFGVADDARLASEAVRRGAVSIADLD